MMPTTHESKHPLAIIVPPPLQIPSPPAPKQAFSDTEIAAAEQLVQLSSSCNSADAGGLSSSSSSSPLSVTTRALPPAQPEAAEEDSHASVGPQRLAHRYRPLAEIYAATNPVGRRKNNNVQQVKGNKRKAK